MPEIESGGSWLFYKQSESPEESLINQLVENTLDVYRLRLRNYEIEVYLRARSTQHIVCLASEIRQVLSNLVTNAIDAMLTGGGRLLVRTREATDWKSGRTGVLVTVADNGAGIPEEAKESIFRAFFTTKGESGTGLGLWISSEIVQRHRGHLHFRSRRNEGHSGSVFQLFLPYQGVSGSSQDVADDQLESGGA